MAHASGHAFDLSAQNTQLPSFAFGFRNLAIGLAVVAWLVVDVLEVMGIGSGNPAALLGIAFVATLLLGVPVAYCMLFAAFLASDAGDLLPPAAVVHNVVVGSSKFVLLAVPLFIAAAQIMNAGGLTVRLIALARALVGHLRGGLAQVNVVTSVFFGFDSGSSTADASLLAMPSARCARSRCPVELTGRNSVMPSTSPRTSA